MTAPVALVQIARDGSLRLSVFGEAPLRLLVVDERCPADRVYEVTERQPQADLDELVPPGAAIGHAADGRHAALLNRIEAAQSGRRHLRSIGERTA